MEHRTMTDTDWPPVRTIYLQGIPTGQAIFQTEAPSWEDWNASQTVGIE